MVMRRILIVLSEYGYWGEELVGPLEVFDAAGYGVDFLTPRGLRPVALPVSYDARFVDPPLGRTVVSKQMAAKAAALNGSSRLDKPTSLDDWFPADTVPSDPAYLRKREAYFKALDDRRQEIDDRYDGLLLVGGSGPMIDMANNYKVKDLIRCFYELQKPIAAECYAVACLAFTHVSEDDFRPLIHGKHVTGHPRAYDYLDGSAFWDRDQNNYFVTRFPTMPLQLVLECAVGPEGCFHGNVGKEVSVIVDFPFVTGRSTPDSTATGEQLLKMIQNPQHRRFGW